MSRNEGEKGAGLLVWMVFLNLNAASLLRRTVLREGMSVDEDGVIGSTLQSDGTRKAECVTVIMSSDFCEFRQVYSSVHSIISTSHYQFT